jgi:hypothetical protein
VVGHQQAERSPHGLRVVELAVRLPADFYVRMCSMGVIRDVRFF